MKRTIAAAAFVLAVSTVFLFCWDILFPLDPRVPQFRDLERGGIPSCLKLLPGRNVGRGGREGDAWNLAFWGTENEVASALKSVGWVPVPLRLSASLRAGTRELLTGKRLTRFPPFNTYIMLGREQDMNWAVVDKPLTARHHFRLWRTGFRDDPGSPLRGAPRTPAGHRPDDPGRDLWWGSGNRDLSIRWRDLSHIPDPDMDAEREFVAKTLEGSPLVKRMSRVSLPQVPASGVNDKGYAFRTDRRVLLVELGPPGAGPSAPAPATGPGRKARR